VSDQALILRDDSRLTITFKPAALEMRDRALELAALVGKVTDAASQEAAVAAQKEINNTLKLIEKARQACKAPILDFGRAIDDSASRFVVELKAEELRVAVMVGDFQALERAKAAAAEQLRQAEARRAEEERRQAELAAIRAAEAEKAKLEAAEREVARLAAAASSKREQEILAQQRAEIERQKAAAQAKSHDELDRIQAQHSDAMAALSAAPTYQPVKASGQRVREEWSITVTDIWLLARAHPGCVKIEPRLAEIKSLLDAGAKVAGVTATRETRSGVSAGRARLPIEV